MNFINGSSSKWEYYVVLSYRVRWAGERRLGAMVTLDEEITKDNIEYLGFLMHSRIEKEGNIKIYSLVIESWREM